MAANATTNVVKTTILVVVASLLAAGVYFGISRINSKPPMAPDTNQFVEDLDELVKQMSVNMDQVGNGESVDLLNSIGSNYQVFSTKLKLYQEESLMTAQEYDAEVENLNNSFAQKYASYYLNRFKTSQWSAADISNIRYMVDDLVSFSLESNGTLAELVNIIELYDQACKCAADVACKSAEEADDKIKKTAKYLQNDYLKNNSSLCVQLRSLPSRLAESCYEYLSSVVDRLSSRNSMHLSDDQYINLVSDVEREIDKYDKEWKGKNAPSTQGLRKLINRHKETRNNNNEY